MANVRATHGRKSADFGERGSNKILKRSAGPSVQLGGYSLCKMCLKRNSPDSPYRSSNSREANCTICRGLFDDIDVIATQIVRACKAYQFQTFLVGAILPTQIYEREDAMRARLKIRGRESVKGQFTRELGIRFARTTGKKVDYLKPDLTASLEVDRDNTVQVSVRSRPLLLSGRYTKKIRGIGQKEDRCSSCEGKGCNNCQNSGLKSLDSTIEGIIASGIIRRTGGHTPRFSWLGSEDRESLVTGGGRPFYVRVYNPLKRNLPDTIVIRKGGIFAKLHPTPDSELQDPQPRFIVKTRISIEFDGALTRPELKKLESLAGQEITLEAKASKMVTKKIYSLQLDRSSPQINEQTFSITIVADGGLGIKQLVGGEQFASTSISQILGAKCHCRCFDILAVTFLSDKDNQNLLEL